VKVAKVVTSVAELLVVAVMVAFLSSVEVLLVVMLLQVMMPELCQLLRLKQILLQIRLNNSVLTQS
jgi:hypothetical protein